jgi:hypothetical protein
VIGGLLLGGAWTLVALGLRPIGGPLLAFAHDRAPRARG